ncbi:hypothetical protein SAMN04487900_11095 [Prevotella communis]|uniref:Uncharacterized protein n=1 Tax=Prevotella communis TaxID=2913614 RepID=A0A1H0H2W8_9BACT|nr:hypothetical protein [Prevotella communis]SDO13404.1 hypothetical protein SAMN04487900_11095 [Prevotella communis]
MMREVTIELSHYNDLRDKAKEAEKLQKEIEQLKEKHQNEIEQLVKEGKVAVMVQSEIRRMFGLKPTLIEIVNMDEVRSEIEQKIIDDEAAKVNAKVIKELAECKSKLSDNKAYIEWLKERNIWQRIRNIF